MRSKLATGGVLCVCAVATWLFSRLYQELLDTYEHAGSTENKEYYWIFRLLLNLFGYGTVLVPGFILYKYLEKTNYFDNLASSSVVSRALYACFGSHERLPDTTKREDAGPPPAPDSRREALELMFCFTGLMGAYLVWGLLQEKIMTQSYSMGDGSVVRFDDSQFLVFINRLAALVIAAGRLRCTGRPLVAAPLYKFSYCALTNIVSAWCQYEALVYVSFPTQVLSKSCKVIPVMLMGVVVSRNKYEVYEYVTAALITVGMAFFMFGSHEGAEAWSFTGLLGGALLALYMSCDAFTTSWQAALFARYRVRPLQMLCAVNLCSCTLAAAALLHRAATARSLAMLQHGGFLVDVCVLSASSALGQLLIYRTIARFGAVVFTIIMTLRQAVSILLSCLVYGHHVTPGGAAGIVLVFVAVLLRIYCNQRIRKRRAAQAHKQPPT